MIIVIPFVCFLLCALHQWTKNGKRVDISTFIATMYGASAFISILLVGSGEWRHDVSFIATIFYCMLLMMNLYPFLKYSNLRIANIQPLCSDKLLKLLAWVVFFWFVIMTYISITWIIEVLTGDMDAIRSAMYRDEGGDGGGMVALPGPARLVLALLNLCFSNPWVLMMLAFFCLYIQKTSVIYFLLFFIASFSGPVNGIMNANRSAGTYWLISLLVVYLFFSSYIPPKHKIALKSFLLVAVGGVVLYLSAMTLSRFGEDDGGVEGSLLYYLGQSYPYFCYFFDEFEPAFTNLNLLFPCTAQFLLGEELVGGVNLQEEMTWKTGVPTGVFYTYLGQIRIFCGMLTMFLFAIIYHLVARSQLAKIKYASCTLKDVFVYLGFSSIMFLGLFGYSYASPVATFSIIFFWFFINKISKRKKVIVEEKQ